MSRLAQLDPRVAAILLDTTDHLPYSAAHMSLSIQDAAAQFELYAEAFEKDAADAKARYDELSRDPCYSVTGIQHILHQMDVAERQAHQLRFCAAFLRDHCIP